MGDYHTALPKDYELLWYRIEGVLGQGAFGITYLAYDIYLDRQVAIKEYMPGQFSMRSDDNVVEPISKEYEKDYRSGLERFLSEARTLTKFKHPNLVQVFNIFEKNNTAYMVMSYEVGRSLKQILKSRKSLGELELIRLLIPLMDGLELMHDKGFIHRDIKPGNIFIRSDNSPVLLDFGSARQTHYYISDDEESPVKTLTNFVSPGYTPIEQYTGKSDRQGPWTDIYALGATLYKCIAGRMPMEAVERSESIAHVSKDEYVNLTDIVDGQYSKSFLTAIDHSLAFKAQNRPQTIKEWRTEFGISVDEFDTIEIPKDHEIHEIADKIQNENTVHTKTHELTTVQQNSSETEETTLFAEEQTNHNKKTSTVPYAIAATVLVGLMSIQLLNISDPVEPVEAIIADTTIETETPIKTDNPIQTAEPIQNSIKSVAKLESKQFFEVTAAQLPAREKTQPVKTVLADATPEKAAVNKTQEKIDELLSLAAKDIQAKRYTVPKNNNAYNKYKKVLSIDKHNEKAKKGILLLTDKYMISAYDSIEKQEFSRARYYLTKADQLSPGLDAIKRARDHLERKEKQVLIAKTKNSKPVKVVKQQNTRPKTVIQDGISVVDMSRDVPAQQKDSIPDNDIDRTIQSIKTLFD